ncbi:dihydrolipoamide acetyltransferase family protein [Streptomyces sp. S.PNR 29]|uniref:dihydrolipoamide acetyltransferase family protein n=1 Tax=Streptomyces sp. S.PNR 29 TaxID=2973805 RepID=UPI0025AFC19F|nr:dihydrolipoamide acetyltransferase family protein [Streptomyces sp. S.PNR 29]MDN0197961.1 2-oxo acid dehydrogenase subunit E2 [Streptomyces sp. S.PNR 29]
MPSTAHWRTERRAEAVVREFTLPDVGEGLTEAEILTWYVKPGDEVTDGQVVCEVETAKAVVELPIPYTGVVHELLVAERTAVAVGTVIITVAQETDQTAGTGRPSETAAPRRPVLVGYGVADAPARRRARKAPAAASGGPGAAGGTRPPAKPPVRKLAKDLGVDLRAVIPSGPGGTVTRDDVHAAHAAAAPPQPAAPPAAVQPPAAAPGADTAAGETRVAVTGVRKAMARAMVASAFTAPHVTEFVSVDVTRTMKLLQRLRQDPEMTGLRLTPLLLICKALLTAIARNPAVNAAWDEAAQQIVHKQYVNLGIAAATPRGLIVPNIKNAQAKTLPELARALDDLVSTARAGTTAPAAMQGGTVTVTNIGVFGVDTGTPILNPGESAILAAGAIRPRPWVHRGKVKPRQVTTLALSFDHRLVDGELGSKVLADTAAVLEDPNRLITWS